MKPSDVHSWRQADIRRLPRAWNRLQRLGLSASFVSPATITSGVSLPSRWQRPEKAGERLECIGKDSTSRTTPARSTIERNSEPQISQLIEITLSEISSAPRSFKYEDSQAPLFDDLPVGIDDLDRRIRRTGVSLGRLPGRIASGENSAGGGAFDDHEARDPHTGVNLPHFWQAGGGYHKLPILMTNSPGYCRAFFSSSVKQCDEAAARPFCILMGAFAGIGLMISAHIRQALRAPSFLPTVECTKSSRRRDPRISPKQQATSMSRSIAVFYGRSFFSLSLTRTRG